MTTPSIRQRSKRSNVTPTASSSSASSPDSNKLGRHRSSPFLSTIRILIIFLTVIIASYLVARRLPYAVPFIDELSTSSNRFQRFWPNLEFLGSDGTLEYGLGHADFDDGRARKVRRAFLQPNSEGIYWVNVMLGNGGPEPDLSGGMIPSVAPPFGMTRWTAQTRQNYVSMCPYNQTDTKIHGFIGTHQPAIWMGESGPAQIAAGLGTVITEFHARGLSFERKDEYASLNYYSNLLHSKHGEIFAELSATSRVGHLRFTFSPHDTVDPYIVLDASRPSVITNRIHNVTYPEGGVVIDHTRNEVYGWNNERQDRILVGEDLPAASFKGYFVARFSESFHAGGISFAGELSDEKKGEGKELSAWVTFPHDTKSVDVRVGVSFISVEQARRNLDLEIPDGQTLESTSYLTRSAWSSKLDTLSVTGATHHNLTVLYTSLAHTLVYPYEVSENTGTLTSPAWRYYSGYLDTVVDGISYSGYSIWDTFRAESAWLLLLAPERVGEMITSMLQDYQQGGWLPMWKNLVETNIMVGTHADSIIAQAMRAGIKTFDWDLAWLAVRKDAFVPPDRDTELRFFDREEHTPQEVRAGLTEYLRIGYVAADLHAESGSRTMDYAYDDWAASIVAFQVGATEDAEVLLKRSRAYKALWNGKTGFMEAKNEDGSWAGDQEGWTEGDHWAYSLDVMHDVPGLVKLMGGKKSFIDFLDRHFDGGHNLHTNEPSHHIPYLYALAGVPWKTQEAVLKIGREEYNHTDIGLSGNEDCGQMSAWYLFSAMGFYPVDPAAATYVIGVPFFDTLTIQLPNATRPLTIRTIGKQFNNDKKNDNRYIKSVLIDDKVIETVVFDHEQIKNGAEIVFELSNVPEKWGEI